ncbi:hypothetical protein [Fischerella thermalis]|nr:hypothetical protein [Fischerella thermalis]
MLVISILTTSKAVTKIVFIGRTPMNTHGTPMDADRLFMGAEV